MKKKKLILEQFDEKLSPFKRTENILMPDKGWIHSLRTTLNITLQQLSERLNTSPQNIRATEEREATGAITIKGLREIAEAMDMRLVYALVPKEESLEKLIEKRAFALAQKIVMRTSGSMRLEDQENTVARLQKAVQEKTDELIHDLPKHLWD
jgi:predicted DNA-binding mobile mystery protein A